VDLGSEKVLFKFYIRKIKHLKKGTIIKALGNMVMEFFSVSLISLSPL